MAELSPAASSARAWRRASASASKSPIRSWNSPSTYVEFTGGTAADSSSIMIIADTVDFKGGDTFLGDFDTSTIMNNALMLQAKLVE